MAESVTPQFRQEVVNTLELLGDIANDWDVKSQDSTRPLIERVACGCIKEQIRVVILSLQRAVPSWTSQSLQIKKKD